jgi:hypothetical protein
MYLQIIHEAKPLAVTSVSVEYALMELLLDRRI